MGNWIRITPDMRKDPNGLRPRFGFVLLGIEGKTEIRCGRITWRGAHWHLAYDNLARFTHYQPMPEPPRMQREWE